MGALEFVPAQGPSAETSAPIQMAELVALASEILSQQEGLTTSLQEPEREQALQTILRVGTSAGGARAKALIAWNPSTGEVRSGQLAALPGFSHWLLKFDGVIGNKDKELEDPQGYGLIEMVFNLVARNQDDHVKNIAFLMDRAGNWSLSPAFDITWSFNPAGDWTAIHQMSVNGRRDRFNRADLLAAGRTAQLKRGRFEAIAEEVITAVGNWPRFAAEAGVPEDTWSQIQASHRLTLLQR